MSAVKPKSKGGKVLSFEQKGEFYYKRGLDRLDRNDLPEALHNYRLALEKDPGNEEISLAMAEVLTEMNRFDDSNRILLAMPHHEGENPERYYGMGCNFLAMYDYTHARDSLERYIALEPDGEFTYDAFDLLDALDEEEYYQSPEALVALTRESEAMERAYDGRDLLEKDDYDGAAELFKKALHLDPKCLYARNNLALAYFCKREFKRAAAEAKAILEMDKADVQACATLAMAQSMAHDSEGANRTADEMVKINMTEPDDLSRAALVLMDLERYQEAYTLMDSLSKLCPYDEGVIHRLGVCAYESGRYKEAAACYDKLLKLDSGDTVARYYRGVCRTAQMGGKEKRLHSRFILNYQVPFDEMLLRIKRLNEIVSLPREELAALWVGDAELTGLIKWGFTLPDKGIKRALLGLVGSFGDKKSEAMLRDFILCIDQSDQLKHEAFALLARQGAEEPYIGYIGGELVESRVALNAGDGIGKPYRDAVAMCLESMRGERPDEAMAAAVMLWDRYISFIGAPLPRMSRAQVSAMAAAIEYLACKECSVKASRSELCAKYSVSVLRFNNALAKLSRMKEQEDE